MAVLSSLITDGVYTLPKINRSFLKRIQQSGEDRWLIAIICIPYRKYGSIVTDRAVSGTVTAYPVSITVSTNVVSWFISIGSSPFSVARNMPEISMSRSLFVTKWMNFEMFGDER